MRYFKRVATTKSESRALDDCTTHTPMESALIQGMGANPGGEASQKALQVGNP